MSLYRSFFYKESHSFYGRRSLAVIVMINILALFFTYNATLNYKQLLNNAKKFQEYEKVNFKMLKSFSQYSFRGIRIKMLPSPTLIFFKNLDTYKNINARIDPVATIDIHTDSKGQMPSILNSYFSLNTADFLLLICSILCMLLGYQLFYDKEYLKFLFNFKPCSKLFLAMVFSRLFFILVTFIFTFGLNLALVNIMGMRFSSHDYLNISGFLGIAALNLTFFFLFGSLIGLYLKKWAGISAILIFWITMTVFLPSLLNAITDYSHEMEQKRIQLESKKLKIISKFEQNINEKFGKFNRDNIKTERKIIEYFWRDRFVMIKLSETNYRNDLQYKAQKQTEWFQFFPTTLYQLTCSEVSSTGYRNYFGYYDYIIDLKQKFVRFYIDHCFYRDPKQLSSLIKGDENLYKAKSTIPRHFISGISITCAWNLILLLASWFFFYSFRPGKKVSESEVNTLRDIQINSGNSMVLLYRSSNFPEKVYNYCYQNFKTNYTSVYYICHSCHFPGWINTITFADFMCRLLEFTRDQYTEIINSFPDHIKSSLFRNLKEIEKGTILLALLKKLKFKRCLFIINNINAGLPFEFSIQLKELMEVLEKAGSTVLYLTDIPVVMDTRFQSEHEYKEIKSWKKTVEIIKKTLEKKV